MGGTWAFPGGKIEDGERPEDAAKRECWEETEYILDTPLDLFARQQANDVDYTTFSTKIETPFTPDLNEEHDAFIWAEEGQWPEPLHPGAKVALDKLKWNELDIARAIRDGQLTSPQYYENIALFAIRITGVGGAYRSAHNEYVWRDPQYYLNDEFLARCNGLLVICEHPEGSKLTSIEFKDRVVGSVFIPYIKGKEVWAIVKIYDAATIDMMSRYQLSTSPAVLFGDDTEDHKKKVMQSGEIILVEGDPNLLDHIAIVPDGVWDKAKGPSGVDTTFPNEEQVMTPEEKAALEKAEAAKADKAKKDAEEKSRKDAEEASDIKKILAHCDALNARVDALEGKPRKDAEGEKTPGDEGDGKISMTKETVPSTPEAVADKARKDAETKERADREEKDRKDAEWKARKDAEDEDRRKKIEELDERTPREMADADFEQMAEAQADADKVAAMFGDSASRPLRSESLQGYRVRMARKFQPHSKTWKDADLSEIRDKATLDVVIKGIYADAMAAGANPATVPAGELREHVRTDVTGRRISEFYGSPRSWMQDFRAPKQYLHSINKGA